MREVAAGLWLAGLSIAGLWTVAWFVTQSAAAQSPPQRPAAALVSLPAQSWAEAAAEREIHIIEDEGRFPLRYRVRKKDDKSDTTREIIESREGSVARLLQRDGRELTRQEDQDERKRLDDILQHPADFLNHVKHNDAARSYSTDLVRLFPRAMVFRYAPGQPQEKGANAPLIVLDFEPDPHFNPPSFFAQLLTGLAGRLWIDSRTRTLVRAQGHVIRPVNFGWGMLVRVHPGATIELEQTEVGGDRWVYSRFAEHIELREVMLRRVEQNVNMSAWDFRLLPAPLSFREAVHALLSMTVPLQP